MYLNDVVYTLLTYLFFKLQFFSIRQKGGILVQHSLNPRSLLLNAGKLLLKVSRNAHQSISVNFHSCMCVQSFWLTLFESIDYYDIKKGGRVIHIPFVGNLSISFTHTYVMNQNLSHLFLQYPLLMILINISPLLKVYIFKNMDI